MGKIVPVQPVTPILGVLFRDPVVVDDAMLWIERLLGEPDLVSPDYPFDLTDHYEPEMGGDLKRRFYSFETLADPEMLADWKIQANRLEEESASRFGEYRPINLDPGYINGAKLVLASVKGLAHRVYIGRGIHAEVTMSFRSGEWLKRDYTFPDFAAGRYDEFFSKVRARHLALAGVAVGA
ncbi:MAG: DUF4416 family protein [Planctomycetes bacterium]|nr:DUF4416 family protein [Planctomycetota bacterium]MCW8134085.1 DUF4416 family protein [Planctomycetota bacterium]